MKKTNETLLSKALAHEQQKLGRNAHYATEEMAQLAIAWVTGKVRTYQVGAALGFGNSQAGIYNALCSGLKYAVKLGLLSETNGRH